MSDSGGHDGFEVRFVDFHRCLDACRALEKGVDEEDIDDFLDQYEEFVLPRDSRQPRVFFDPKSKCGLAISPVDSAPIPYGGAVMRGRWFLNRLSRRRLELRLAEIGASICAMRVQGHSRAFAALVHES